MAQQINPISSGSAYSSILLNSDLPTKENAQEVFWGLKDNFWKQIIDGKYHKHGHMVFDENLHGNAKEPGFFASLKEGCLFASKHLTERPSVEFYSELHQKLCAHFKGSENNTLMLASEAGNFRTPFPRFSHSTEKESSEAVQHYSNIKNYESIQQQIQHVQENAADKTKKSMTQKGLELLLSEAEPSYLGSKKWIEQRTAHWNNKVAEIQSHFKSLSEELSIPNLCEVYFKDKKFRITYDCPNSEIQKIVPIFFTRYNQKIDAANLKLKSISSENEKLKLAEEKLGAIAELYQHLEWLHPFLDGQGRTDLVLQAKLLTEQGFNPAILHDPYTSSWSTFEEWKSDLLKGIENWKQERQSIAKEST